MSCSILARSAKGSVTNRMLKTLYSTTSQNANQRFSSRLSVRRLWPASSPSLSLLECPNSLLQIKSSGVILQTRTYTKRNILELVQRGLWKDRYPPSCEEFEAALTNPHKPLSVYAGFDPTADSLHIGNLLILMSLIHCQRAGHSPIVLIGGFTAGFSDPSGRTETRRSLDAPTVEANTEPILAEIQGIFENHEKFYWADRGIKSPLTPPRIVDNKEWLSSMSMPQFMSLSADVYLSQLTKSEFISKRISDNGPLPMPELLYQVFQGIDWLRLYEKHGCILQIGGSDQAANIWLGRAMVKKKTGKSVTGLTVPLVTTEGNVKLGKSAGNAVWLSSDKTSCFDFYQYFFRRKDSEVEQLLKLFTFRPLEEITNIMSQHWKDPGQQNAQRILARDVTRLIHGEKGLEVAIASTEVLYQNNARRIYELGGPHLEALFSEVVVSIPRTADMSVLQAARQAGYFHTDEIAERTIRAGGFSINQVRVTEPNILLVPDIHVLPSGYSVFRSGKRNFTLVKWT